MITFTEVETVPSVNGKKFGYGKAGVAAAKRESARTGQPMRSTRPASAGSSTSASRPSMPAMPPPGMAKRMEKTGKPAPANMMKGRKK